jgi:ribosome-binding protein aMBF1 (putative translation factor)
MADIGTLAQIDKVDLMERELSGLRRSVALALRFQRESALLSLRDVAVKVRLTPAALSNLERGKSWRTKTARRVAEFYSKMDAA